MAARHAGCHGRRALRGFGSPAESMPPCPRIVALPVWALVPSRHGIAAAVVRAPPWCWTTCGTAMPRAGVPAPGLCPLGAGGASRGWERRPRRGSWTGAGSDLPRSQGRWDPGKCLEMVNRLPLYGSARLALLRPRSAGCPTRHPRPARPLLSRRAVPWPWESAVGRALCPVPRAGMCYRTGDPAVERKFHLHCAGTDGSAQPRPLPQFPLPGEFWEPTVLEPAPRVLAFSTSGLHPARQPGGVSCAPFRVPAAPSLGASGGAACSPGCEGQGLSPPGGGGK